MYVFRRPDNVFGPLSLPPMPQHRSRPPQKAFGIGTTFQAAAQANCETVFVFGNAGLLPFRVTCF